MISLLVKGFHDDVRSAIGAEMVKSLKGFQADVLVEYVDGYSREPIVEFVTDHEKVTPDQECVIISRLMHVIMRCKSMAGYHGVISTALKFSKHVRG